MIDNRAIQPTTSRTRRSFWLTVNFQMTNKCNEVTCRVFCAFRRMTKCGQRSQDARGLRLRGQGDLSERIVMRRDVDIKRQFVPCTNNDVLILTEEREGYTKIRHSRGGCVEFSNVSLTKIQVRRGGYEKS